MLWSLRVSKLNFHPQPASHACEKVITATPSLPLPAWECRTGLWNKLHSPPHLPSTALWVFENPYPGHPTPQPQLCCQVKRTQNSGWECCLPSGQECCPPSSPLPLWHPLMLLCPIHLPTCQKSNLKKCPCPPRHLLNHSAGPFEGLGVAGRVYFRAVICGGGRYQQEKRTLWGDITSPQTMGAQPPLQSFP